MNFTPGSSQDFGYASRWPRNSDFGLTQQTIETTSVQRERLVLPYTSDHGNASKLIADNLEFSGHEMEKSVDDDRVSSETGEEEDLASSPSNGVQRNSDSEPVHAAIDPVVARWLEKLGLKTLSHVFAAESVDSMSLALLSHEQLKELGVQKMGDRSKLLRLALQRIHLNSHDDTCLLTPESGNASLIHRQTPPWMDRVLAHSAVQASTPRAVPIDVAHDVGCGEEDEGITTSAEKRVPSEPARGTSDGGEREEDGDDERGPAHKYSPTPSQMNLTSPVSQKQASSAVAKRGHRMGDTDTEEEVGWETMCMGRMQMDEVERRMDRLEKARTRRAARNSQRQSRGGMGDMSSDSASRQGKDFHPGTDGNPFREAPSIGVAALEHAAILSGGLLALEEVAQDGDLRVALEENRLLHAKIAHCRARLEESEKRHQDSSEKMGLYEGLLNEAASPLSATEAKSSSAQRIRRSLATISLVSVLREQVRQLQEDKQAIENRCERAQQDLLALLHNVHASLEESQTLSDDVEACMVELTDSNMALNKQCSWLRAELDKQKQQSQSQVLDAHRKVEVMIKIAGLCCSTLTRLKSDVGGLVADITQDLRGQEAEMASQRTMINSLVEAARRDQDEYESEIRDVKQIAESLMWSAGRAAMEVDLALTEASREQGIVSSSHNAQIMELERRVRTANAAVRQCQQNLEMKTQHCHRDQIRLCEALAQLDILASSHKEQIGMLELCSLRLCLSRLVETPDPLKALS